MTQRFWIGETVRVQVNFTDVSGAPMAASGVVFTARPKDGTAITGTPVALQTTGSFYADFPLNQAGIWYLRTTCTAPTATAVEDSIEVRASLVL